MNRIIVAALALMIPSALNAQIIEACYVKNTGTVYRVEAPNSPAKCANNHISFSWNQAGQIGPQGIQGPVGPQGPAGTSGVMGYQFRTDTGAGIPQGAVQGRTRFCAGDEVVVGGGFHTEVQHDDLQVVYSGPVYRPDFPLAPYGWAVRVRNTSTTTPVTLVVVALCAKLPTQ